MPPWNGSSIDKFPIVSLLITLLYLEKQLTQKLNRLGLKVSEDQLVSANYAGVLYLKKQGYESCQLVLRDAAQIDYKEFDTDNDTPQAIVVGDIGESWDYPLLNGLMMKLLEGAHLVALHKGRYFQTQNGLTIDSGAFVAALEHATQTKAKVVGKPEATFFELATLGFDCEAHQIAMVGDDLINDIGGAQKMEYQTFLVKTGKYRPALYKKSKNSPRSFDRKYRKPKKIYINQRFDLICINY